MLEFVNYLAQLFGDALFRNASKNYVGKILVTKKNIKQLILTHNLSQFTNS